MMFTNEYEIDMYLKGINDRLKAVKLRADLLVKERTPVIQHLPGARGRHFTGQLLAHQHSQRLTHRRILLGEDTGEIGLGVFFRMHGGKVLGDPGHAQRATRYETALRERNRLLDGDADPDPAWMDAIEAQLAEHGATLCAGRIMLVERLNQALETLPDQPFARPVLSYVSGGPTNEADLADDLRRNRQRDRAARRTLSGPHRDELNVAMAGKGLPASACSTGEQKAMLIAITLAHARLAARGRPGILLLDEVAAHLDPIRRGALFDRLGDTGTQVWMTGTEMPPFEAIRNEAAIWHVNGGAVQKAA